MAAAARQTMAYCVPLVSVAGLAKFAVKLPPAPLQKPAMVAVARSAPVGRLPEALRIETVMFGIVTDEQLRLNRLRSTRVSCPVTAGVKVYASHVVFLNPAPCVPSVLFCWSIVSAFNSVRSPGVVLGSTLDNRPVWKSLCD